MVTMVYKPFNFSVCLKVFHNKKFGRKKAVFSFMSPKVSPQNPVINYFSVSFF